MILWSIVAVVVVIANWHKIRPKRPELRHKTFLGSDSVGVFRPDQQKYIK
jgi:hypothetical protein